MHKAIATRLPGPLLPGRRGALSLIPQLAAFLYHCLHFCPFLLWSEGLALVSPFLVGGRALDGRVGRG